MVVRAMRMNFSWEKSAVKYVDVFKAAKVRGLASSKDTSSKDTSSKDKYVDVFKAAKIRGLYY